MRALVVLGALLATFVAGRVKAYADGGGVVVCIDGVCTIQVQVPGSTDEDGQVGSGPDATCHNTNPTAGCDPCVAKNGVLTGDREACWAWVHNQACSNENPYGVDPAVWDAYIRAIGCAGNPFTPEHPGILAQRAAAQLVLPGPGVHRSPDASLRYQGDPYTYVNLPTWFWTDPSLWRAMSRSVMVGAATATATATPTKLVFTSDGGSAACAGPGRAWTEQDGAAAPESGCSFTYEVEHPAPVAATVSIRWVVTWTGSFAGQPMGGTLPEQATSSSQELRVLQVSAVNR
jgi:hypothetical protein